MDESDENRLGLWRHDIEVVVFYTVFYTLVFIAGLLGNFFVVLAVALHHQLRTTTDYLISSLAVADLLIILFCLPTTLLNNVLTGQCVDTGEFLGGSLTRIVDTYVGIAGPNHGISLQVGGLSLPGCAFSLIPICNTQTGLYSGICPHESTFIRDINSASRYEGRHVFTIYSKTDQVVGYQVCGKVTARVAGQNGEKVLDGVNHDDTFHKTHDVQLRMVRDHRVV